MSIEDSKVTDLQNAWKEMEKAEKAPVAKPQVALTEGANDPTPTSKKFGIADTHSKPVKPVAREIGAAAGAKEVGDEHGSKAAVTDASPVKRGEGAAAGLKEVGDAHGSKAGVGKDESVPRKEGAQASVQKYADFRAKIKSVLGLSLTDPLNSVGKGLNK